MKDTNTIKQAKLSRKSYDLLAESIYEEYFRRKLAPDRAQLERRWSEVDRQVDMIPTSKQRHDWQAVFELPSQANALETLVADVDNMRFSGNGRWFTPHVNMNQDYAKRFAEDVMALNPGAGLENFQATQSEVNAVVQGMIINAHKEYRFNDVINLMDVEAMKYGTVALRTMPVKRHTFREQNGAIAKTEILLPVVTNVSIKHYLPDDLPAKATGQGQFLTPLEIFDYAQRCTDIKIAAQKGGSKTTELSGGWITDAIDTLEPAKPSDLVDLIEAEGDFVLTGDDGSDVFIPGLIITVAYGKGVPQPTVIRARENPFPFSTVTSDTYFKDKVGSYGVSPLMKGETLQMCAQIAAEAVVNVASMQSEPILWVNGNDPYLKAHGINVRPREIWRHAKKPEVVDIGDLNGSMIVYQEFTRQFENSTGVNDQRQGAQTKSHQTAYAVNQETAKGQNRTVRYVRGTETFGILSDVLQKEAYILRNMAKAHSFFVPEMEAFITASGEAMPDEVMFDIKGATTDMENAQKDQQRLQALQLLFGTEQGAVQAGAKPMDLDKVRSKILEAVFPNSEVGGFFKTQAQPQAAPDVAPGGNALPNQPDQLPPEIQAAMGEMQ